MKTELKQTQKKLDKAQKRLDKLTRDLNKILESYKDFRDYLYQIGSETTTEEELQSLYNKTIDISLNGHKVKLAFDAVNYNNLIHLVEQAIKEF
jgi:GTP1/Obg family GTP-binding protein